MKYYVIGIWDENTEYGLRLAEYLMHCTEYQIQIMTFSEPHQLVKWMKSHSLDVLITGGENSLEKIRRIYCDDALSGSEEEIWGQITAVIELQDKAMDPVKSGDGMYKISRYWSSLALMEFVCEHILKLQDMSGISRKKRGKDECYGATVSVEYREKHKNVEIIGIFSPVARCGKTTLAVALTQLLGKEDRSLMICMDQFSEIFSRDRDNLSDLIFRIHNNCNFRSEKSDMIFERRAYGKEDEKTDCLTETGDCIENLILRYIQNWNQMDYIPAPLYEDDLNQISSAQMAEILKLLKKQNQYRYIVVDIRTGMDNLQEILRLCDHVFMPDPGDTVSSSKIHVFEELMRKQNRQEVSGNASFMRKIHKIRLPEVIQTNTLENYYKELGWSSFGKRVREVMEQYDVGGAENCG